MFSVISNISNGQGINIDSKNCYYLPLLHKTFENKKRHFTISIINRQEWIRRNWFQKLFDDTIKKNYQKKRRKIM